MILTRKIAERKNGTFLRKGVFNVRIILILTRKIELFLTTIFEVKQIIHS
jgi:hypothetical protein